MNNKTKKWIYSPLASKTLLDAGLRMAVVTLAAAVLSYFLIFYAINHQVKDSLQKYTTGRVERESNIFLNAERNHQKFKDIFLQLWPQRRDEDNQERFERLFVTKEDGTTRMHADAFDGMRRVDGSISQYISGYIEKDVSLTDTRFQNRLLLSYDLIDRFAEAWALEYANLYVWMPENVNLMYWPGIPWGDQAAGNLKLQSEEWVYVADYQHNPERKPVWTGLYFDQTADEWVVSLETPVDLEGKNLINIGHDIALNTLFDRVFNHKLEGTYNFIFREDGRIIAHPDLVEMLSARKGILYASDIGDSELMNLVKLVQEKADLTKSQSIILDSKQSDALLAVSKIRGPDWYFVTYYPKSLLSSIAIEAAQIVCIIGLISLILELLALYFVLKRQVLEPVKSFGKFSQAMGEHNFSAIDQLKNNQVYQRRDEMGQLAATMISMACTIQLSEDDLENLVAKRTRELDQTNAVLSAKSKDREEVVALLETIAKDVSGLKGQNYFHTLTVFLAKSLSADFVIICRLSEDAKTLHSLSVSLDNKHIDNISYPVKDTPCEIVIEKGPQIYNGDVQEKFPFDDDLVSLDLHSYIGTPLLDAKGYALGHLAVMKREAFEQVDKVKRVVESVSSRAASELLRQVYEETIIRQAQTDPLTHLPNRTLFIDRLTQAILQASRQRQKLAVIFIDFDNFKLINDHLGHKVGDELLLVLAERLNQCIRQADTLARMGGDEFMMLLTNINDLYGPEMVIRTIQKRLNEDITIGNNTITASCSMGVAIYPDDATEEEILIKNADMAMYRAKELGRNNYQFFTQEMNTHMEESRRIERDLQIAIRHNNFELYYQPIVNLNDGKITKVEALLRWIDPEKGIIYPDSFLHVAERTGQIVEIDKFVLDKACEDFERLKKYLPHLQTLAVNFSARQFHDQNFVFNVVESIKKSKLTNHVFEIEITENLFIDKDDQTTLKILRKFKELGFSISLDDFGTGYSSLAYLKNLPIDIIKIDRSFVRDITDDKEDLTLVTSIIELAHNFNLSVVAEGVETQSHETILREYDCDFVQGYYYSKAISIDELTCSDFDFSRS